MDVHGDLHEALLENIRARIRAMKITQRELGVRLGVTEQYVSILMAGRNAPGVDLIERIAEALETTGADLLRQPSKKPVNAA